MFELNSRFQIAAIVIWLLILNDYRKNNHLKLLSTRYFQVLLGLVGCNLFFDLLTVYTITNMNVIPSWVNRLSHQLFIGTLISVLFVDYLYICILASNQKRMKRKEFLITLIPMVVSIVLIVVGPLEYFVDGKSAYSYGAMAYVVYVCGVLYLLIGFMLTLKNGTSLTNVQKGAVRVGFVVWIVALIIQMFFPRILVSGLSSVLLVLSIYFPFENQRENYDAEVECFNRTAFHKMLSEYYERKSDLFLVNVVCDNLARINNLLGHEKGRQVLRNIESIMEGHLNERVYHSRTNILSVFYHGELEDYMPKLEAVQNELNQLLCENIRVKCHIGVMEVKKYTQSCDDVYELMGFMAQDKKIKGIQMLNQDIVEKKTRKDRIGQFVVEGLKNDGFEMFYQPIYSSKEKKFASAEALIRMKNIEELGFVSPEEFIPIAEEMGLIMELGDRVFEMVAEFAQETKIREYGIEYIEVNLSRIQAVAPGIAERLKNIVEAHQIPASFINVEITETATVDSEILFEKNLRGLKAAGFELSMDDFGTGYSNLAQVCDTAYDLIKLDKSLIWPAFDEEKKSQMEQKLLGSIIHMLHSINMKIVAEGVETEEMTEYLIQRGVEYLQGYYYSRPIPGNELIQFLKEENHV